MVDMKTLACCSSVRSGAAARRAAISVGRHVLSAILHDHTSWHNIRTLVVFCSAGRTECTLPEDFASSGTWLPRSVLLYVIVNCRAAVAFTSLFAGSAVYVLVVKRTGR